MHVPIALNFEGTALDVDVRAFKYVKRTFIAKLTMIGSAKGYEPPECSV